MNNHYFRLISFELLRYITYNIISFVDKLIRELLLIVFPLYKRAELMPIRDFNKEVNSSSDDEKTFHEDIDYSLKPDYDAGHNIRLSATILRSLKRPFSLPYESSRDGAHFSIYCFIIYLFSWKLIVKKIECF